MKGMKDWNEMNIQEYIDHLENKFRFDSSGTAKAVFELIREYKALKLTSVGVSETELCACKYMTKEGTIEECYKCNNIKVKIKHN